MTLSDSIISEDQFFIQGLINTLGNKLIDKFFLIIDLDCYGFDKLRGGGGAQKNIVAFTSGCLSSYNLDYVFNIKILSKRSRVEVILDYFIRHASLNFSYAFDELTRREWQILSMIIHGAEITSVAKVLGLSMKTVYTHRRNIMNKLGCENRISFYKLCLKNKPFSNLIQ